MIFFEKRILRGGKCGEKGVYLHCGMTALLPSGYLEKGRVYFYTALKRLYDFIPVKHLCVGMSLCGIVAGTQTAQASPVFGQSSGLELPSPSIYQQSTKQISGIVKDQAGIPVIGANVIVKGTTNGVITGLDGDFLLEVPENATLEISYIGYMTQSIPINGKTTFNIILEIGRAHV